MSKMIYHLGTGTYFDLDDDVFVIDTDDVSGLDDDVSGLDSEVLDIYGDEIAVGFGKRIVDIVTEEDN